MIDIYARLFSLDNQKYLEARPETWRDAARIFFELRRRGQIVRSPIDCCIAQLALEHDASWDELTAVISSKSDALKQTG